MCSLLSNMFCRLALFTTQFPCIDPYPVHTACRQGDVRSLQSLINEGHSVNELTFDLVQPLHDACFHGNVECVGILIAAGANVNGRNIDGSTPLCEACARGDEECVKILLNHGATVNPQLLLSSPLHEAVLVDKWRCAELLINAGAYLDHTDCHYGTPLHAAVSKQCIDSIKILLKAGCNVNCVRILTTPLHLAASQQNYEIVKLLLDFNADPHFTNNQGLTPKHVVPSSTSPVRQLLNYWESNPRSLKFCCRRVIRKALGPNKLSLLPELNLPKPLNDYITYKYL